MRIRTLKHEDGHQLPALFRDLTTREIDFQIEEVLADNNCHAIVLEDVDEKIIGFAALVIHRIPTKGRVGKIEDVVVAKPFQGAGLGGQLMDELIMIARRQGLKNITLTSNPSRGAARRLYEKKGFDLLATGVFLLAIK